MYCYRLKHNIIQCHNPSHNVTAYHILSHNVTDCYNQCDCEMLPFWFVGLSWKTKISQEVSDTKYSGLHTNRHKYD